MSTDKHIEKLDQEVAALEAAHFGVTPESSDPNANGELAESVVADPSTPVSEHVENPQASPTSESFGDNQGAEPKPQKKERVSWKKRYINLKQHHDVSTRKSRLRIADLLNQATALQQELTKVREELHKFAAKTPTSVADLATKEELNILGEEGVSSIDKLTKRAVEAATSDLTAEVKSLQQQRLLDQQREAEGIQQDSTDDFLKRLLDAVPDYQVIDDDPRFGNFLKTPDPASGRLRLDLFRLREAEGDVEGIALLFNTFKQAVGKVNDPLANKITPVGSQGSPNEIVTPNNGEVTYMKMSDYSAFMNDVNRGEYKGRQKLADEIEAKFDLAIAEGRLI